MISTQRLLMLIIGFNLIIGLIGAIYENPAVYQEDYPSTEQAIYEDY